MRLRGITCTAVAAMLATLTACGGGGGGKDGGPGKGFTAPTKFSVKQGVPLPESASLGKVRIIGGLRHPLAVALHDGVAFIARPDGLDVVNGYRSGKPVTITPEHEPVLELDDLMGENPAEAPLITATGGKTLALSALVTKVTGSGTAKSHDAVELMATDTQTATKPWFTEIPLPADDAYYSGDRAEANVVGRSGDIVVVFGRGRLFGVDLKSHRKVWTAKGTYAKGAVVVGDRVVALRGGKVVGIGAADGQDVWTSPRSGLGLSAAGPDAVMTYEYPNDDVRDRRHYLLDAVTGHTRRALPEDAPGWDCAYDGAAVTVCTGSAGVDEAAAAYDPKSGKEIWRLPDAAGTRVAPEVTLVRAGLVYGEANGKPVVLDAASGKDKETRPGIAPYVADGYVAISETEDETGLTAYRAVG
ncbi:PQQ-binding-like beta-propeller repeat protein [Streptomyces sp. XD-27]|uniref:outer membrane protein assembly factor BamB family protein n=1 Tax=Streptomyces sp. XD-27 TaxID=3062779 RepID=UPI0026F467D1|nr:PQQ-binding-like beta-propeller repeat protein [Streptomyces sp. XD-27]WKX72760.1 PQQ-binding-like beta-propeller repeat protein [Streptomyces sp. XD-27]